MKEETLKSNAASQGESSKVKLPPRALVVTNIEGTDFITDGQYRTQATKGPYTLKPFRNPSGKVVTQLSGYRPGKVAQSAGAAQGNVSPEASDDTAPNGPANRERYRKNFPALKEADAARSALILEDSNSENGLNHVHTMLNESKVRDAERAWLLMAKLPPPGWTEGKWTFLEMVQFVAKHFRPCRNPKPLEEAVKEFIAFEKAANLRYATVDGKQTLLNKLIKSSPSGIMTHQVPVDVLMRLIHIGKKKKTWRKNKSTLSTFFAWASDEIQGYCPTNPVSAIHLRKKKDDYKVPKILCNEVVRSLLTKAQGFKRGRLFLFCVLAIAVALRPAELARIQALLKVLGITSFQFGDEPEEKLVNVIGKTRQCRYSAIPPEFVPVIQAYVEAGYPVIPRNFAHDWTLLRAQVGYMGRRDLLPAQLLSNTLAVWVKDVLRHVGITHHLNRSGNEHTTALWAGDSPKMIFFHYKGKATKKQTREFYATAEVLKVPTVAELKAEGIPEGASDAELRRLKCPVDEPNTFFMDAETFQAARQAYIARCPEAAKPEIKGPRRGTGMWTKRRMLELPKTKIELILLVWTQRLDDLAREHKVARSTMALALQEAGLEQHLFPPKGHWQQRAAGHTIPLPPEVQEVFPNGLPPCEKPVGRQIRLKRPSLVRFFRMVWEQKASDIAVSLGWSKSTVEREIRGMRLPRPEPTYWLQDPKHREIPEKVKHLLGLNEANLRLELSKEEHL